jgi:hypothetical protein
VKPSAATSYPGTADVATIMQSLAGRMTPALGFQNNGVKITLTTPYLNGTLIDQIRTVARIANINAEIHNGTLYIWPRNSTRPVAASTISPANGLVGYPSFNGVQILGMRTLFDPTLEFGQEVSVQSSLTPACGSWYVNQMIHTLESITPGGPWFTDLGVASLQYILGQPGF